MEIDDDTAFRCLKKKNALSPIAKVYKRNAYEIPNAAVATAGIGIASNDFTKGVANDFTQGRSVNPP